MSLLLKTHYPAYIDGQFVSTQMTFPAVNVSTGEHLASIARCTAAEVELAVSAAYRAQKEWKSSTFEQRSALLNLLADELEKAAPRLAAIDAADVGRRIGEVVTDYNIAVVQYRYFAGAILTHEGFGRPIPNGYLIAKREPVGVVGQIIPWNVPAIMVALNVAPAIVAGNAVVLKPDENASLSALEFAELAGRILPDGLINVVPGFGTEVGSAITAHPGITKLAFTGSPGIGRVIRCAGAQCLVPVSLELGGKSPNIVFPDITDIDAVVDNVLFAAMYCNGQSCLAGTRLFIHDDIYANFTDKLANAVSRLTVGNPMSEATHMSRLINRKQGERVLDYIKVGKEERARLLVGGERVVVPGHEYGYFIQPTVFEATNTIRIAQKEIFGPVLSVIHWNDYDTLLEQANDVRYGLASGINTSHLHNAMKTADALETGNVWVNHYFNLNSGASFGGAKESGIGREHCHETLNQYSQLKSITVQNDVIAPWFAPAP